MMCLRVIQDTHILLDPGLNSAEFGMQKARRLKPDAIPTLFNRPSLSSEEVRREPINIFGEQYKEEKKCGLREEREAQGKIEPPTADLTWPCLIYR